MYNLELKINYLYFSSDCVYYLPFTFLNFLSIRRMPGKDGFKAINPSFVSFTMLYLSDDYKIMYLSIYLSIITISIAKAT